MKDPGLDFVHRTADRVENPSYDISREQITWFSSWLLVGLSVFFGSGNLIGRGVGLMLILVVGLGGAKFYEGGYGYRIVLRAIKNYRNSRRQGAIDPVTDTKTPPISVGPVGLWLGIEQRSLPTLVLVDYIAGTGTILLSGTGWNVNGLDPEERASEEKRFTEAMIDLSSGAGVGRYAMGFTLSYGSRRVRVAPLLADVLSLIHPDFRPADGVFKNERDEAASKDLDDRFSLIAAYSATPVSLATITIRLPDEWVRLLRSGDIALLSPEEVMESDLASLARNAVEALERTGISNPHCLDLLDGYAALQLNRNLAHFDKFDIDTHQLSFSLENDLITPEDAIKQLTSWEPLPSQKILIGRNYMLMDGTYFRFLKTRRVLRPWFLPGALQPAQFFQHPRVWATSGVCSRIIPAEKELSRSKRFIVFQRAKLQSESTKYYTLQERREQTRLEKKQDELVVSGGPALRFWRLHAVCATSLEDLDKGTKELTSELKKLSFRAHTLNSGVEQVDAFLALILGVTPIR